MKTRAAVAVEAGKPLEIMDVDLEGPRPGEVLVETLTDLKNMFENSELNYIYLPEIDTLIKKRH